MFVSMRSLLALMRPYQYTKNLFIFAPAFFAFQLTEVAILLPLGIIFFAFCLLCSSVYIFNDIVDCKHDRLHPTKRNRPIASGAISPFSASLLSFCLFCLAMFLFLALFFMQKDGILSSFLLELKGTKDALESSATTGGGG